MVLYVKSLLFLLAKPLFCACSIKAVDTRKLTHWYVTLFVCLRFKVWILVGLFDFNKGLKIINSHDFLQCERPCAVQAYIDHLLKLHLNIAWATPTLQNLQMQQWSLMVPRYPSTLSCVPRGHQNRNHNYFFCYCSYVKCTLCIYFA